MERWVAKVIALLVILIIPFGCTIIPYKVSDFVAKRGAKGLKLLSCLMCFGGGVFFATYILHMGPEVRDILDKSLLKPNNITYPVSDLIMASGFFLVFFLEKLSLKLHKRRRQQKMRARREKCLQINKLGPHQQSLTPLSEVAITTPVIVTPSSPAAKQVQGDTCCGCKESGGCCSGAEDQVKVAEAEPLKKETPVKKKKAVSIEDLAASLANASSCPLSGTGECCTDPEDVKIQGADVENSLLVMYTPTEPEDEATISAHNTRSLVLILALSLHRIFEGMTVGLQHTEHNVWNLLIAVMCHEMVIGFSMGLQFVKNGFKLRKMLIASLLCSLIMPVGVVIGTVISEVGQEGNALNILNGVLQGIATGTFIYVTFFEILQEEIDAHDTCLSKVFAVFVGFAVMAALSAVPEEDPALNAATNGHTFNVTDPN